VSRGYGVVLGGVVLSREQGRNKKIDDKSSGSISMWQLIVARMKLSKQVLQQTETKEEG
jgi:hypothetical protein